MARSRWKDLRYRAEVGGFRGLMTVCRLLPAAAMVQLGSWLGGLGYHVDRKRRGVAFRNLDLAYGDALDAARKREIVQGVYRHLGRFTMENLILLSRKQADLSQYVRFENLEPTREALRRCGRVVFVTAHIGHWELMGSAVSQLVAPVHSVMKPLRNVHLNRHLVLLRRQFGMEVIEQRHAVKDLIRALRDGNSVALLTDQNHKRRALFVDFFGVPAATVATGAVLAVRFGLPMVCGYSHSTGTPMEYIGRMDDPIWPDPSAPKEDEVRRLTEAMNRSIERAVRDHPDQWNWIHPRWRTRPEDEAARQDAVLARRAGR